MSRPPPLTHELRFTHVASGARIAWARSGRTGAPTLVRAAHWMTHVEFDVRSPLWQVWLERLGQAFTVVRYDERGCGCSGSDDRLPDLETAVEELDAVVLAHGASPVVLLGISGATPPAIAYAARFPERVSHLVLLGGYTHGLRHRNVPAETLAYHDAQVRLVETGWGRNDPAVQEFFTSRFLPDGTPEARAALTEQQRLSCSGPRAAALMQARALLDVRLLAPLVRAPTLVLHCAGDMAVPVAMGHELAAAIPGARFESLPSRNHIPLPHEPAFERLCQAITAFAASSPAVPALTTRERELAALVGQGLDNAQLAARLGVAEKTVRNMLSTLYAKLDVEGRPQAVARARDLRL